MRKTLTLSGKKYTGKQIAKLMTKDKLVNECDHAIRLYDLIYGDLLFYATFRGHEDGQYYPVCDREDATAIALMPCNERFGAPHEYSIWLSL